MKKLNLKIKTSIDKIYNNSIYKKLLRRKSNQINSQKNLKIKLIKKIYKLLSLSNNYKSIKKDVYNSKQ